MNPLVGETPKETVQNVAEKDTRSVYTHLNVNALRPFCEVIDKNLETQDASVCTPASQNQVV